MATSPSYFLKNQLVCWTVPGSAIWETNEAGFVYGLWRQGCLPELQLLNISLTGRQKGIIINLIKLIKLINFQVSK